MQWFWQISIYYHVILRGHWCNHGLLIPFFDYAPNVKMGHDLMFIWTNKDLLVPIPFRISRPVSKANARETEFREIKFTEHFSIWHRFEICVWHRRALWPKRPSTWCSLTLYGRLAFWVMLGSLLLFSSFAMKESDKVL